MHSTFDIDDLIVRYLSGETTSPENQFLSDWFNKSSENLLYFNSIRNIWLASAQAFPSLQINQDQILKKSATKPKHKQFRLISQESINKLLKIAAILILVIGVGAIVYNKFGRFPNSVKNSYITVEATIGSKAITTLPDGTKVWLNSGSKLTYDGSYNGKIREVKLVGEAYFSVVTNPSKPFIVNAGKLSIMALGTMFNVKAYPEDKSIITTLVKGKVVIEGKDDWNNDFVVQMKPKEAVTYFKEEKSTVLSGNEINKTQKQFAQDLSQKSGEEITKIPVAKAEQVNTDLFTSWKDTRWIIEKQKLGDLARDFERRYNIKIEFLSDTMKQFHFTGIIENETIEQIMIIIRHTIPLRYEIEKGVIRIGEDSNLMKKFYN